MCTVYTPENYVPSRSRDLRAWRGRMQSDGHTQQCVASAAVYDAKAPPPPPPPAEPELGAAFARIQKQLANEIATQTRAQLSSTAFLARAATGSSVCRPCTKIAGKNSPRSPSGRETTPARTTDRVTTGRSASKLPLFPSLRSTHSRILCAFGSYERGACATIILCGYSKTGVWV
jgi:hypothetical protein